MRADVPWARTVTPPWPAIDGPPGVEVDAQRGVLVDPEDEGAFGELALEKGEALFTQIAEPGVVGSALGVVVVGDDRHPEPDAGEQIEPLLPSGGPRPPCRSRRQVRSPTPRVRAAAEAKVTAPPRASFSASSDGTSVPRHWRSA